MSEQKTVFFSCHLEQKAKMVDFAGWNLPLHYPSGIIQEHLEVRKRCGLFDISHLARFTLTGPDAFIFLQRLLTNDLAELEPGQSHYTLLANQQGFALDDAYLFHYVKDQYLLVVNAANHDKIWHHLREEIGDFRIKISDITFETGMLALQGPNAQKVLEHIYNNRLPPPQRNALSIIHLDSQQLIISRTGYTGEPVCFEIITPHEKAQDLWENLIQSGAIPVGLGARDTLRLEAGLPLYGNELGPAPDGTQIPIFALTHARHAVSFDAAKGEFIGKEALLRQYSALEELKNNNLTLSSDLPQRIRPLAPLEKGGVARHGDRIFLQEKPVGFVTSGTIIPYWLTRQANGKIELTDKHGVRPVAMALLDSNLPINQMVEVQTRTGKIAAQIVSSHLRRQDTINYAIIHSGKEQQ